MPSGPIYGEFRRKDCLFEVVNRLIISVYKSDDSFWDTRVNFVTLSHN